MENTSCRYCGASNASDATFCRSCGAELSKVKRQKSKGNKVWKFILFASSVILLYWLYALAAPTVYTHHYDKKDYKTGLTYQKISVRYHDPLDIVSGSNPDILLNPYKNDSEVDSHNTALGAYKGKVFPILIIDGIVLLLSFYFYQRKRNG